MLYLSARYMYRWFSRYPRNVFIAASDILEQMPEQPTGGSISAPTNDGEWMENRKTGGCTAVIVSLMARGQVGCFYDGSGPGRLFFMMAQVQVGCFYDGLRLGRLFFMAWGQVGCFSDGLGPGKLFFMAWGQVGCFYDGLGPGRLFFDGLGPGRLFS